MLASNDVVDISKIVLILIIIIIIVIAVIIFHGLDSVWHKSFNVADVALSLLECFQMTDVVKTLNTVLNVNWPITANMRTRNIINL